MVNFKNNIMKEAEAKEVLKKLVDFISWHRGTLENMLLNVDECIKALEMFTPEPNLTSVVKGFSGLFKSEIIPQPDVYTDNQLNEASWEEYDTPMVLCTTTKESYPEHIGKCISGSYSAYTMSTIIGDFLTEDSIRGEAQAVIVFSDTGKGYIFS